MPVRLHRPSATSCLTALALAVWVAAPSLATVNWFSTLPAAKQDDVLWKEDHEGSTLSWDSDNGEPWASGDYSYGVVTSPVHSGTKSIRSTIDTSAGQSGVRWAQREVAPGVILPSKAYYSSWVYFPAVFDSEWYMLMQWKTEISYEGSDPVKSVNLERGDDNRLHLALYDFVGTDGTYNGAGSGMRDVAEQVFPTGQWVHLEAFYQWDQATSGSLRVWQNGVELLSQTNTRTEYPYNYGTLPRQWAVNAYGDELNPNPHTMYIDDAAISRSRLSTALMNPLAGDFNIDGHVDAADYTLWRDGLGSIYTQADYLTWKSHFGQSTTSATANSIPEPATLILLALTTFFPPTRPHSLAL